MKKLFLLIVAHLLFFSAYCQEFLWSSQKRYSSDTYGRAVLADNAGNSYVLGSYSPSGAQTSYTVGAFLHKYDVSGNALWQTPITGIALGMDMMASGKIIVAAYQGTSYYIAKYDQNGTELEKVNILLPEPDNIIYSQILGIGCDASENYYIMGAYGHPFTLGNFTAPPTGNENRTFLAKFNSQNTCTWLKTSTKGVVKPTYACLAVDVMGNCYLGGQYDIEFTMGAKTIQGDAMNGIVAKFDTNGNAVWMFNIGSRQYKVEYVTAVSVDAWGNVYATGCFGEELVICGSSFGMQGVNNGNVFITKIDNNGAGLWAKQIGGANYDESGSIFAKGTDVFVTGTFAGTCNFDSQYLVSTAMPLTSQETFVSKYDLNGTIGWAVKTGADANSYAEGNSICADQYKNVFVTGRFDGHLDFGSKPQTTNGQAMFVAKLSSDAITGIGKNDNQQSKVELYPNPSTGKFNVQTSHLTAKKVKIVIYNTMGQTILTLENTVSDNSFNEVVDLSKYGKGVYYLQISTASFSAVKRQTIQ